MKVSVARQLTFQPKQFYSHIVGGTVELSDEDHTDIIEISQREGITAPTFVELAGKVAKFLANQRYQEDLEEYKAKPASDFALAK